MPTDCPIRFKMCLPTDVDVLDTDWEPLPAEPTLKERADAIGKRIAAEEDAYLRQRLAEIAWLVGEPARERARIRALCEKNSHALRVSLARDRATEREALRLLGIPQAPKLPRRRS